MVNPVIRTPQEIAQTEAVLQALISKVPGLLRVYYGTRTKSSERELTDTLSAITRNNNYTREKLSPYVEGSLISKKMLGQLLNLPISVKRNILDITDRGMLGYSTNDSGVDQAFYAWFSPNGIVLDEHGNAEKMQYFDFSEDPWLTEETDRDVEALAALQELREYHEEVNPEGDDLYIHSDTDGFRGMAEAFHAGHVLSDTVDLGGFDYRQSDIANEGREGPIQSYIKSIKGSRAIESGAIAKMVEALPLIKTHALDLSGLAMSDSQFRSVLGALIKNPYIREINLGDNNMDHQTSRVFRQFLKQNRTVTSITFSGNIAPTDFVRTLQTMSKNHTIINADFEAAGQAGQALEIPSYDGRGNSVLYEPRPMLNNILTRNRTEAGVIAQPDPALSRRVTFKVPQSRSIDSALADSVASTPAASPAISRKAEAPVPPGVKSGPSAGPH